VRIVGGAAGGNDSAIAAKEQRRIASDAVDGLRTHCGFDQLRINTASCDLLILPRAAANTISAKSSSDPFLMPSAKGWFFSQASYLDPN
jgi:hypothetical protein